MSEFPTVIDSSMLSAWRACPQQFFNRYILGLHPPGKSVHLHFGGCYARGLEMFRNAYWGEGKSQTAAVAEGLKAITIAWGEEPNWPGSNKTYERCLEALVDYVKNYPPATERVVPIRMPNGECGGEFSFAYPLEGINHPTTGLPLLYSGRVDMLAKMGGLTVLVDDKTTTQLGPSWSNSWRVRAQFSGYVWLATQWGYHVDAVVIRGISILKERFGHAEVIETRPPHAVERWLRQTRRDVLRMKHTWAEYERSGFEDRGVWDYDLDSACSSYGGCTFLDMCVSKEPQKWQDGFAVSFYNPITGETTHE